LVLQSTRAPDHTLRRDPVDVFGDRSHEVAAPAGRDERREPVGLEIAEQLDHGTEHAVTVSPAKPWMLLMDEGMSLLGVFIDGHASEGPQDPAEHDFHL
jgi:hypothetical protein